MSDADDNEVTESKNQVSVNRRRFVKAIGVTGATSVFGVGTAAGKSISREEMKQQKKKIKEQYSSVSAIQDAIDNLGSDYLQRFDAEGFFETPIRDEITNMEITTWKQMVENNNGISVDLNPNDTKPTADIVVRNNVGGDVIEVHILPGTDRSFAVKNPTPKDEEGCMTPLMKTQDGLSAQDSGCICKYQCHSASSFCDGAAWFDHPEYCVTHCPNSCSWSKIGCCTVQLDCNAPLCTCE